MIRRPPGVVIKLAVSDLATPALRAARALLDEIADRSPGWLRRLRELWPLVWRSTYERDVRRLQERLEEERAWAGSLHWWRRGRP